VLQLLLEEECAVAMIMFSMAEEDVRTVMERQVGEQAERMMVQITRDTVLKKGEEKAFLFQLEGSSATVAYVKEGDQKVATSVVTKPAGR
jgi:hypothetical protein